MLVVKVWGHTLIGVILKPQGKIDGAYSLLVCAGIFSSLDNRSRSPVKCLDSVGILNYFEVALNLKRRSVTCMPFV